MAITVPGCTYCPTSMRGMPIDAGERRLDRLLVEHGLDLGERRLEAASALSESCSVACELTPVARKLLGALKLRLVARDGRLAPTSGRRARPRRRSGREAAPCFTCSLALKLIDFTTPASCPTRHRRPAPPKACRSRRISGVQVVGSIVVAETATAGGCMAGEELADHLRAQEEIEAEEAAADEEDENKEDPAQPDQRKTAPITRPTVRRKCMTITPLVLESARLREHLDFHAPLFRRAYGRVGRGGTARKAALPQCSVDFQRRPAGRPPASGAGGPAEPSRRFCVCGVLRQSRARGAGWWQRSIAPVVEAT